MEKKKNKKKDTLTLDENINSLNERVNKLDYSKGLKNGIKEYKSITNEIDDLQKKLTNIEDDFIKINTTSDEDNKDVSSDNCFGEDEYFETVTKIKNIVENIKITTELEKKIELYKQCNMLVNKCNGYTKQNKMHIEKYE